MSDDVTRIVSGMKRSAMAAEYHRRLVEIVPTFDPDAPAFDRPITGRSSMRLVVIAAARQGFDAGRFADSTVCPYQMGAGVLDTLARRAWMLGFDQGRRVEPRPAPRPLTQRPIIAR